MNRPSPVAMTALILTACSFMSKASAQDYSARAVWEDTALGPDSAFFNRAVEMPDGDVVCLGSRDDATGFDLYAERFDIDGNLEWSTTLPNPYGSGYSIVTEAGLNDLGEIVILAQISGGATAYDYRFLALDGLGNVIADRVLSYFGWDEPAEMEIESNGDIVVCGSTADPGQYVTMKLDRAFNTQWTTLLGHPGQDYQYASDLTITPNGDVLVIGQVNDGSNQDVRVDRLSPTGVPLYSLDFGDPVSTDTGGIVCASSSGATYVAYRHAAYDPTAEARIYRIDPSGTIVWSVRDPDLVWVKMLELDNDEIMVAGVGPFSGPTAQTFRRFTSAGVELDFQTLVTPGYQHNYIRAARIGPDDILYTLANATPTGGSGTHWFVNALTLDGRIVFQWSLSKGPNNYPNALIPLGLGEIIACGQTGEAPDSDAHVVRLQAELIVPPESAQVLEGEHLRGNLSSLASVDDDHLEVCVFSGRREMGQLFKTVFETTIPQDYPQGEIEFSCTAQASSDMPARLELWNWTTHRWEKTTRADLSPTASEFTVQGDLTHNIDAATGQVRARFLSRTMKSVTPIGVCVKIDQAVWRARP